MQCIGKMPVKELMECDLIVGLDNSLTPVSSVLSTGRIETVYQPVEKLSESH